MNSQKLTADESTELENTVVAAKGVKAGFRTSKPYAKEADDGRVFVGYSTSHTYGRSNGLDELNAESDRTFVRAYSPHGGKSWACEPAEELDEDDAEARLVEGVEVVMPDGSTGTVTEADYFTKLDGASASFGLIHTSRLVEYLAAGVASFVADAEDEQNDEDDYVSVRFDGAVRKFAEGEARVEAMYGDELAQAAFSRFSSVVRVTSADEAAAVFRVLDRVEQNENLKTNQKSAVRRVKARMVSAEAILLDTDEPEQDDEGDDEPRLVTDGGEDVSLTPTNEFEDLDEANEAGGRGLYDALDEAPTRANLKAVELENVFTDNERVVSLRLRTPTSWLSPEAIGALDEFDAGVEYLGEDGRLFGHEWLVYLPA